MSFIIRNAGLSLRDIIKVIACGLTSCEKVLGLKLLDNRAMNGLRGVRFELSIFQSHSPQPDSALSDNVSCSWLEWEKSHEQH